MKSSADACLPESVVVPKYVFQQETFYQPVAICYDESRKDKISVVYHCCPTSWLLAALTHSCLIDRFLEGQRAYYSPCQIPSRRCESVRYSIVKWWLNLLLCFELNFLLPWCVHSISEQTNARKLVLGSILKLSESTRCGDILLITLNWSLVPCNSALVLHNYTFQQTSSSPSISLIDQCDCNDGWTERRDACLWFSSADSTFALVMYDWKKEWVDSTKLEPCVTERASSIWLRHGCMMPDHKIRFQRLKCGINESREFPPSWPFLTYC